MQINLDRWTKACTWRVTSSHPSHPMEPRAPFDAISRESLRCAQKDHSRLTHEIELFYYTKRDSQVVTSIGGATVASYREEDQMLVVTLPYCRPLARMYIPVEKVRCLRDFCVSGSSLLHRMLVASTRCDQPEKLCCCFFLSC